MKWRAPYKLRKLSVNLFLCVTKYHTMKSYCGEEVYLYALLMSALD